MKISISIKKILLFGLCLLPAGLLTYQLLNSDLGADPIEKLLDTTGIWALRFLLITLSITTVRKLFKVNLIKYRRMLGLFAFFYLCLHLLIFLVLDHGLDFIAIFDDIIKKKFIFVGMLAFILLIPLAVTSTKGWMRRLGKKWARLHRLIYSISILGILHFLWLVKSDLTEPLLYGAMLAIILGLRRFSLVKAKP